MAVYTEYNTLTQALSSIGTTDKTLVIAKHVTVSTSTTIPSTIKLIILKGGKLIRSGTAVVTINGAFEAGQYKVFQDDTAGANNFISFGAKSCKSICAVWFGATGDGITDDTTALQTSIDVAEAIEGSVVLLPGTYITSSALTINSPIKFILLGEVVLKAETANTYNGINIGGFYLFDSEVPHLDGYSVGLCLQGSQEANIKTQWIVNCTTAVRFETINATHSAVQDCTVYVQLISACTTAIEYYADNALNVIQGCESYGNIIINCTYGLFFNANGIAPSIAYNKFCFQVVDLTPAANAIALYSNATVINKLMYRVETFFGGIPAGGYYIKGDFVWLDAYILLAETPTYDKWNITGQFNTLNVGQAAGQNDPYYAAVATGNSRASFNVGVPLYRNREKISITLAGEVANNVTTTWYIYHQLLDEATCKFNIVPSHDGGMSGFVPDVVLNNNFTIPNEIAITFRNVSGSAAIVGTVIKFIIEVGI